MLDLLPPCLLFFIFSQPEENVGGRSSVSLVHCLLRINHRPQILLPVYVLLLDAYTNLSEGEEMITPELMLGHLVDWTDPEKAMWARLWSSHALRFSHALSV